MRSCSLQFNISINGAMVLPSSSSSPREPRSGFAVPGLPKGTGEELSTCNLKMSLTQNLLAGVQRTFKDLDLFIYLLTLRALGKGGDV